MMKKLLAIIHSIMVAAYDYIINIDYVKKTEPDAVKVILTRIAAISCPCSFTGMGSSGEIDPRCPNGGRLMAALALMSLVQQDIKHCLEPLMDFQNGRQRIERERLDIERQRVGLRL